MTTFRLVNGTPKPGHEFQYWLAWKHRGIAGQWLSRASRNPFGRKYNRVFKLWSTCLDRISEHGQDVIQELPPNQRDTHDND